MANFNIITQVKRPGARGDPGNVGLFERKNTFYPFSKKGPPADGAQLEAPPVVRPRRRRRLRRWFARLCRCYGKKKSESSIGGEDLAVSPAQQYNGSLLEPQAPEDKGKKTLVLDLDETLVHSSFKPIDNADYVIPIEIEDQQYQVYVSKRPHMDEFLTAVSESFEVVVFTASLAKYADPLLDLIDPQRKTVRARLFREACIQHEGNYVKDLGRMGRLLKHVVIIDNSPASYMLHPQNALPILSWFDDTSDKELLALLPILEQLIHADDVVPTLKNLLAQQRQS